MKRQMERNKRCVCKQCGNNFDAVRYNAETCSDKCRKAYQRWIDKISLLEAEILFRLEQLKEYRDTDAHNRVFNAISKVAKRSMSIRDDWES